MDYVSHLKYCFLVSLAVSGILVYLSYADLVLIATGIFVCLMYTLLPDVDHPVSVMRKYVLVSSLIGVVACVFAFYQTREDVFLLAVVGLCVLLLALIVLSKHRGFFHTVYACVLFSLPLLYFSWVLSVYALVGYLTHLLVDKV